MAIDIITGFNSASRESLDKRSGPYASLADAKAALDTNERFIGLKVLVISNSTTDGAGNYIAGDLTEYVFDGGITDNDLVEVNSNQTSLVVGENNTTSQNISIVLGNGNVLTATDAPSAAAGVTLYDSFNYPGGAFLKHQADWDGPSGQSWRLTGTGKSLFFNQGTGLGLVTDGSKHIWCESQVQNYRNLDTTISAQTTYCTMLVRAYDTAPYDPDVNPNPGTGGVERVKFRIQFYSGTDASGNMRMNIGIEQGTLFASAATSGYGAGDTQAGAFEDDKTYLLAMKRTSTAVYASLIEADGDPSTLLSEPNWQVTDSGSTGVSFQSISLFGNNTDPDNDRGIRVDELRIADNWEDVVAGLRYDEASKSIAIGTDNTIDATSDAIAIGKDNNLSGVRSYAMGEGLKDFGDDSTLLLGRYNEDPADDSKIVIANGVDDDDRFTAMEFKARTNAASNNSGVIMKALLNSPSYADDSAAQAGDVEIGELYRTGSTIRIRTSMSDAPLAQSYPYTTDFQSGVERTRNLTSITNLNGYYNNKQLTSIYIGSNVSSIDYPAFTLCSNLNSVTISEGMTSIGGSAFRHCVSLTSITIPESVTILGSGAFFGCTALTSARIGSGVTLIDSGAFRNCSNLNSVTISEGVTTIGYLAFQNCTSLTSITIPASVTKFVTSSFENCTDLATVNCLATAAPTLGTNVFNNIAASAEIHVPVGATGYGTTYGGLTVVYDL